jgi:hypothetical protein
VTVDITSYRLRQNRLPQKVQNFNILAHDTINDLQDNTMTMTELISFVKYKVLCKSSRLLSPV